MALFTTFAALAQLIYCAILISDGRPLIMSPKLLITVAIVIVAEQIFMWARGR